MEWARRAWILAMLATGCAIAHPTAPGLDASEPGPDAVGDAQDVVSNDGDATLDVPVARDVMDVTVEVGDATDSGSDGNDAPDVVPADALDAGGDVGVDVPVVDTGVDAPVDTGSCPTGETLCGGACVVTSFDANNCGRCGNVCTGGQTCTAGACSCPTGEVLCGSLCFDTQTDVNHCGSCDGVCASGMLCAGGTCVTACPSGQTACGSSCVNEQTDPNHCGGCSPCNPANVAGGATCTAGVCGYSGCAPGFSDCDGNAANGCELPTAADVSHCGSCSMHCLSGPSSTATCAAGACGLTCATGTADCNHTASDGCEVDTTTDVGHCGACDVVCPSGASSMATCTAGVCGLSCSGGHADCNHVASDGCETNLGTTDNCQHCGDSCSGITPFCSTSIGCW